MDPVSPLPAIACLFAAVATSFFLEKQYGTQPLFGPPLNQGRYASIDGLRGYLAFFVFLHHSSVWYFYLRSGKWEVPPSNLYTFFGEGSVAIFFMITGFLFFSKLIDGRTKSIDWGRLFISRFMRLVPLYVLAMFLLFLTVAFITKGTLNVPALKLMQDLARWLGFTILGTPNLNGLRNTSTIVAGVTWSLPYEWFFYFSLPVLALTVRVIPPIPYIALGIASFVGLIMWHPQIIILLSFLGGITASFLVRYNVFRQFAAGKLASFVALGCVAIAIAAFPSAFGAVPLFLLSVAFVFVAGGNSLFGTLVSSVSRTLGEMAYSIYLLHGITLFVIFYYIIGATESRAFSPVIYWLVIIGITPILITICFVTFRVIENPAMQSTTAFTAWLRSHFTKRSKGVAENGTPR